MTLLPGGVMSHLDDQEQLKLVQILTRGCVDEEWQIDFPREFSTTGNRPIKLKTKLLTAAPPRKNAAAVAAARDFAPSSAVKRYFLGGCSVVCKLWKN